MQDAGVRGLHLGPRPCATPCPAADHFGLLTAAVAPPQVRRAVPQVRLSIVGANPTPWLLRQQNGHDITVEGQVDDIRPAIQRAAVCLAPLVSGAGIRTKVIQYAALRRPCVATSIAAADLLFVDGESVAIADDAAAMAARTIHLLSHPDEAREMAARCAPAVAVALLASGNTGA